MAFGSLPKKKVVEIDGKKIELEPKPSRFSKMFGGSKPGAETPPKPPHVDEKPAPFLGYKPGPAQTGIGAPQVPPVKDRPMLTPEPKRENLFAKPEKKEDVGPSRPSLFSKMLGAPKKEETKPIPPIPPKTPTPPSPKVQIPEERSGLQKVPSPVVPPSPWQKAPTPTFTGPAVAPVPPTKTITPAASRPSFISKILGGGEKADAKKPSVVEPPRPHAPKVQVPETKPFGQTSPATPPPAVPPAPIPPPVQKFPPSIASVPLSSIPASAQKPLSPVPPSSTGKVPMPSAPRASFFSRILGGPKKDETKPVLSTLPKMPGLSPSKIQTSETKPAPEGVPLSPLSSIPISTPKTPPPIIPAPTFAPPIASMAPIPPSSTSIPRPAQQPVPQVWHGNIGKGKKLPGNERKSFKHMLEEIGAKHKDLETSLRKSGLKLSVYEFVRNMLIASVLLSGIIGVVMIILLVTVLPNAAVAVMLGGLMGVGIFIFSFNMFLNFPSRKENASSKNIERDILFAARDMIISLRSGMPLFNALTSISTGYGDASKEFLKVVEKVQLGTPLDEAIDQTVGETKSPSFRKIMLQASVSIKVGADITSALQSVIDQLSQERVIELRRYGQRLNAIAMFYMLFGIIVPSMGIAVIIILTTFISIFTVTSSILNAALVGIVFLQIIFLQMIRTSRPVFSM